MKKIFFTTAVLFTFGFANAQETKFGLKAGLNISNFTGDVEGNSFKPGIQAGAFVEIKTSDKMAIQPELMYSSLGGVKFDYVTLNFDYLVLPVMVKYFATEKFTLEAGPQIGFLLSAKAKTDEGSEDVKSGFNSTDFGVNLGAGYDVSEKVNLSLRYTAGLSNILKDAGNDKGMNINIAIALGFKF